MIERQEKGNRKRGRPKGSPNRFTGSMKSAVLEVFRSLGGVDAMADWAKENRTDFYRICAKLVPQAVAGEIEHIHRQVVELPDDELAHIAAGGRAGASEAAHGEKDASSVH